MEIATYPGGPPAPDLPLASGSEATPGPEAALISNSGTFEDIGGLDVHQDPYRQQDFAAEEFSYPKPGKATNCGAPVRCVRACLCGVELLSDHCDQKTCEHNYCRDKNRDRRARDIREKMEAGRRGRALIYTVFTVPPRLRKRAGEQVTLRPRRKKDGTLEPHVVWRWQLWLAELIQGLKDSLCLEFACERSDPTGKDGERWHPHFNLLWVREDGSGWISPEQLEALKSEWKRIIGEHEENPVSVYSQWADPRAKVGHEVPSLNYNPEERRGHWYRYQGRTWPAWEEAFPYHCRVKWFGQAAPRPEIEPDHFCKKCEHEIAVMRCGSLEAAQKLAEHGYARVLEEQRERVRALRRGAKIKTCVVDGVLMPRSWFESGLCEIPKGG